MKSFRCICQCSHRCTLHHRVLIMQWWQEMLHPWDQGLLPRSMKSLIGLKSLKKACFFSLMSLCILVRVSLQLLCQLWNRILDLGSSWFCFISLIVIMSSTTAATTSSKDSFTILWFDELLWCLKVFGTTCALL